MLNYKLVNHLKTQYKTAYPFPHIVIDNFMDEIYLKKCLPELPYCEWGYDYDEEKTGHQIKKYYTPFDDRGTDHLPEYTRNILGFLNSMEVINFLEDLTGIQGLIPDYGYYGGGVHRIQPGGKLSVHADYNYHPITKLHRRLNLLLYLNKDWKEEWGGDLQLWEKDLSKPVKIIQPIFNRAVIFSITSDAYHGHPGILKSPEGVDRYSFALYYFTEDRPDHEKVDPHMAVFHKT